MCASECVRVCVWVLLFAASSPSLRDLFSVDNLFKFNTWVGKINSCFAPHFCLKTTDNKGGRPFNNLAVKGRQFIRLRRRRFNLNRHKRCTTPTQLLLLLQCENSSLRSNKKRPTLLSSQTVLERFVCWQDSELYIPFLCLYINHTLSLSLDNLQSCPDHPHLLIHGHWVRSSAS